MLLQVLLNAAAFAALVAGLLIIGRLRQRSKIDDSASVADLDMAEGSAAMVDDVEALHPPRRDELKTWRG